MFGQPASSTSLFGSGNTQPGIFGASSAAQTTGGLFGTPSTGGLFGSQSTGGLFGATSASQTGLFGAQPSSASLFGTPASSAGLFGGAPASSGGLFGSMPASSGGLFGAPASSGGLFGASSTSVFGASSGGLFGAGAASSGGLFGSAPSQPASSSPLFGAAASALVPLGSTGALQLGASAASAAGTLAQASSEPAKLQQLSQEQQALVTAIKAIDDSMTPGSAGFKYTRLFSYVVDAAQRTRPPKVPESQWRHALAKIGGKDNSAGLWPVAVHGVAEMMMHEEAQVKAREEGAAFMAELGALAARVEQQERQSRARVHAVLHSHNVLSHRLLKVVRMVDALEAQTSSSPYDSALHAELAALAEKLARVESECAPHRVHGLKQGVHAFAAAAEVLANMGTPIDSGHDGVDERSLSEAAALLGEHNKGINELRAHLKSAHRDIAVFKSLHGEQDVMRLT